jgi:hypothetical protein
LQVDKLQKDQQDLLHKVSGGMVGLRCSMVGALCASRDPSVDLY